MRYVQSYVACISNQPYRIVMRHGMLRCMMHVRWLAELTARRICWCAAAHLIVRGLMRAAHSLLLQ
jgi:hypothetical protein